MELSEFEERLKREILVGDMTDIGNIYDPEVLENLYKEAVFYVHFTHLTTLRILVFLLE